MMNIRCIAASLCVSLLLVTAERPRAQAPAPAPAESPRLVVLCSVDQLASWVLASVLPFCKEDGGFRRLLRDGTLFAGCAYQHGCTETGPGHATIGTGAPANGHGIVKNQWFDVGSGKKVYCVDDDVRALPDLPEGKDRGPGRLLVPTFGDALKAHVPGARVGSVAWKDRSAILMAGRSADAVVWMEYSTGRLVTNTAWVQTTPDWLRQFNDTRPVDAFFGWKWERSGPPDAYVGLIDDRPFEAPHANGSKQHTLPQPLTGGLDAPAKEFYAQVYASPIGNEIVLLAAQALVRGTGLGSDATPDLLCVGFSSTDVIGHQFGPDSVEARDGLLRLDEQLARLLRFLDEQVGRGRYLFVLTSDHGVGPTPEAARAQGVHAGRGPILTRARAAAEKALAQRFGARTGKTGYIRQASENAFFFDATALQEQRGERSAAAMQREACEVAAAAALQAPGVFATFVTADLLRAGTSADPLTRAMHFAIHPDRAGDVQLVLEPYWLDGMTTASHGSPHAYDREVPLVAMGPGIRMGQRIETPVSPGIGVVLASRVLGLPKPIAAVDELPAGVLLPR